MFCTGGIRCEKASAYLLEHGFEEVFQLDGGVLNYLATAGADNRFDGECFVFDQRVSVDDGLVQGRYSSCTRVRTCVDRSRLRIVRLSAGRRVPVLRGPPDAGAARIVP